MKKIVGILLLSSLFSSTTLNAEQYIMQAEKSIYEGRVIVGDLPSQPQKTIVFSGSYYDGSNSDLPGFYNVEHYCSVSHNIDRALIYHGAYTCKRNLNIEHLQFDKDNTIDISFNLRRLSYGSNYYAGMSISGLFSWYYHRDKADFIRYGYQEGGSYKQKGNPYNSYVKYRIFYKDGVLEYYQNDTLVDRIENFTPPTVTNGIIRVQANNSRLQLGNIKIEISK